MAEYDRMSEYARGYADGARSLDAERAVIVSRLRGLSLDGGSHENLSQIAGAIWHSDFGWTSGACVVLRDKLVELLGGAYLRDTDGYKPGNDMWRTGADDDALIDLLRDAARDYVDASNAARHFHDQLTDVWNRRADDVVDKLAYFDDCGVSDYHQELRRWLGEARATAHNLRQSRRRYEAQGERNRRLERENRMLRNMLNDAADEYAALTGVLSLHGITVRSVRP